jgi:glycosyltransferase involved in cell wall biosynthesis
MKVMQINVVHKTGSTGKIVYGIHKGLVGAGIESVVCYGRGARVHEDHVYKAGPEWLMKLQSLRSRLTGYVYAGCFFSTRSVLRLIRRENPDIVHLHCINGYFVNIYKLLNYLKDRKIRTVLTLHAEFMYTAGCSYSYDCEQWKTGCCENGRPCPQFNRTRPPSWIFNRCATEWRMMRNAFRGFDRLVICAVSDWLRDRAIESPFMSDKKVITVMNGLDTEIFKRTSTDGLKDKHGLTSEKIILHVTPNFLLEIKGGKYVLELAKRLVDENVKIIIIGYNGNYKNLPANVIPVGHISNQAELSFYYSLANLTLLTSAKETFSMICAETLSCGTPVVGFKAGAPETISIKDYSEFVEQGDVDALEIAVRKWLSAATDPSVISGIAGDVYSMRNMVMEYRRIYKR